MDSIITFFVGALSIITSHMMIINGESMAPTLSDKDKVYYLRVVNKKISNKHIVILNLNLNPDNTKEYFVKRIIGVPGDTLEFREGYVYIKPKGEQIFTKLNEPYLNLYNQGKTFTSEKLKSYKVPEGKYFVMGDNRQHSSDSRSCFTYSCSATDHGPYINKEAIVGIVLNKQ